MRVPPHSLNLRVKLIFVCISKYSAQYLLLDEIKLKADWKQSAFVFLKPKTHFFEWIWLLLRILVTIACAVSR